MGAGRACCTSAAWRLIYSYNPLVRGSKPHHALRSKLHLQTQTQFQVPWRLPTLTRRFSQVADMGDGGGGKGQRQNKGGAPPPTNSWGKYAALIKVRLTMSHSPGEDDANQFHEKMSPLPAVCLRQFIFVPVVPSLAFPSCFPPELEFCPAPGMRCCCCDIRAVHPVRRGLRSLPDSPFREENYRQVNV